MSLFSSEKGAHPHPMSLQLKEKLAKNVATARKAVVPTKPTGRIGQAGGKKVSAKRKTIQYVPAAAPREPWFSLKTNDSGGQDLLNILHPSGASDIFSQMGGNSNGSEQFKSAALLCEWKFREARNRLEVKHDDNSKRDLDKDLIGVCCRVLGDLAPVCGPIRRLLMELKEEFQRHIYSDFDKCNPGQSELCTVPFFEEVQTLRDQVEDISAQRLKFRDQLVEEVKKRRSLEVQLQRTKVELAEVQRTLQEAKQNIANIAKVAEHARENYHRIRDDHEIVTKELQAMTKEKHELATSSQQQINIYQIRLTQLSNELNKALQELTEKNKEINRLKLKR